MKRSEVVQELAVEIYTNCETTKLEAKRAAEAVLKKVEELGMLPPRTMLQPLNLEDNAWDQE